MTLTSEVDSLHFNSGILIFNSDQGKQFYTEFNSQMRSSWNGEDAPFFKRLYYQNNPYLKVSSENGESTFGLRISTFRTLFDDSILPSKLGENIVGMSFNAFGSGVDSLKVEIYDVNKQLLVNETVKLENLVFQTYHFDFNDPTVKEIKITASNSSIADSLGFGIDDLYLKTSDEEIFTPPSSDAEFLAWLKETSFTFFDWNYKDLTGNRGVVYESNIDQEIISLSGLGYAYPIFVIAAEEGYISHEEAKRRIESMLNWQMDQNWFDGSGGWHGIPHHYFKSDGTYYWPDVSTIDWAICAAGLRVVRQYYANDPIIVEKVSTLLDRPSWSAALAENDKIAMGFDGLTGKMNDYRWALAFSEETELVYLEAVASGDLDASIFASIVREKKAGYYPSWFGAGFTYNWLQLWTGTTEPYYSNSVEAYSNDAKTSMEAFGRPLMGLTACSTIKEGSNDGFFNWGRYISNQGGDIHGSLGGVIQISPAPYGAALALPFSYSQAMIALREFVDLSYYHPYLGLPDNVRILDLPEGQKMAPNWNFFDINIAPIALSIEQIQDNRIGNLYLSDPNIQENFALLVQSFGE